MTTALEIAADLVLPQYTYEPCRICGDVVTMADVMGGAVYIGHDAGGKSRVAHKTCWINFLDVARQLDASGGLTPLIRNPAP